jgi:hypothetical protein
VLALLALLAEGCGEEAAREREPAAPAPAPQVITARDHGKTFTLAPGAGTSLRLSGDYDWSEPAVAGDAVALARVDYFQDPGFSEWAIEAVSAGTATIAARGTPTLRFQVKIVVAP